MPLLRPRFLPTLPKIHGLALVLLFSFPLGAQSFTLSLGTGLSFSGRDDTAYALTNNLSRVEGIPAPLLEAELGLRLGKRLTLGLRLMDLERGTENGVTNNLIMPSVFVTQTPLLLKASYAFWPQVDGQKWNFAVHVAGGAVAEHQIRRQAYYSTNSVRTNIFESLEPFSQVHGVFALGATLSLRANGVAVVNLGLAEMFIFSASPQAYPVVSLSVELEFGGKKPPGAGGDAPKSGEKIAAPPGKKETPSGEPGKTLGK